MKLTKQEFDALPLSVREQVKGTLTAYSKVNITFHGGEYHVNTGIMIYSEYPSDFRVIGDVHKDDVYTPDEQIINYINSFHDYPYNYRGARDYSMLRYMTECRKNGEERKVELVDGNARLINERESIFGANGKLAAAKTEHENINKQINNTTAKKDRNDAER